LRVETAKKEFNGSSRSYAPLSLINTYSICCNNDKHKLNNYCPHGGCHAYKSWLLSYNTLEVAPPLETYRVLVIQIDNDIDTCIVTEKKKSSLDVGVSARS
jgi:hypothetical protein